MGKAKATAHGRRRRRNTARGTWWCLHPMTLALLTWISAIGTVTPPVTTWLGNQYQQYEDSRVIEALAPKWDALVADVWRAQLARDVATSIAKDDAWLAAHHPE